MLPLITAGLSAGACPSYGTGWYNVTLDASISYVLHHKVVGTGSDAVLHIRMEAKHSGWLGFGLAEHQSGHMKGSDLVTAYVTSSGKVHAEDRYAAFAANQYTPSTGTQSFPTLTAAVDQHQDWTVVSGFEVDGKTAVHISRPVSTGDSQDRTFTPLQPTRIVWAYGASDTVGGHSGAARGSRQVSLGAAEQAVSMPANDGYWERKVSSYSIPQQVTTYSCQSFSFPTDQERHIVAFEPLIAPGLEKNVHHFVLHTCDHSGVGYWNSHSGAMSKCDTTDTLSETNPSHMGTSPLGQPSGGCDSLAWSWAIGQGPMILPSNVGIRTGTGSAMKLSKVVLEIHYDNPTTAAGKVDTSGFRAYYVNTPRTHDAGMIRLGDPLVSANEVLSSPYTSGPLAANTADIHRQFTCPGSCTNALDGSDPMNIIGIFHHMHYLGRKMYLEHYDSSGNLKASTRADRVDFWDNGYQQFNWLDTPIVVAKGESLQTHCFFDTTQRSSQSNFGSGTPDEMCMQFALYYPIRTKGVDSDGDAVLFGDCGGRLTGGEAKTICGGPTQTGGQFMTGGQVDRGSARFVDTTIADSNFGASPSASLGADANGKGGVDTCTFNPPSPPPALPPPTLPPGAPGASAVWVVTFVATVAGTVDTFDQASYKTKLAAFLDGNVTAADISLTVTAASIKVTAEIRTASASVSEGLVSKIAAGSTAELTQALGVEVLSKQAPQMQVMMLKELEDTPSLSTGVLVVIIVVPIIALIIIAVIVILLIQRKKKKEGTAKSKEPAASSTSEATDSL